jgi:hypothetical protein
MRIERTMMAADVTVGLTSHRSAGASLAAPTAASAPVPADAGKAGTVNAGPSLVKQQKVEAVQEKGQMAPVMPGLSASDRAAIASATGYYITASGKVTPEGMPPWGFIARYIEQRHAERTGDAGGDAVEGTAPVADGDHVDVTV